MEQAANTTTAATSAERVEVDDWAGEGEDSLLRRFPDCGVGFMDFKASERVS